MTLLDWIELIAGGIGACILLVGLGVMLWGMAENIKKYLDN